MSVEAIRPLTDVAGVATLPPMDMSITPAFAASLCDLMDAEPGRNTIINYPGMAEGIAQRAMALPPSLRETADEVALFARKIQSERS